ncbi:hypothetical protein [Bradyrhizobium sp. CCGE-LA001]|uniref:hypothetical protein n=1 Tax=Bradyrhizobium sp. CCGE-LA001 TaxID=1223566 RepID=UPI0002E7261E|nr:hypothetical protein [Bradyrhizobium sp. CCGE-LA001]
MPIESKSPGWPARDESEHFIRCTDLSDTRELGAVHNHLHGQEIPVEPTLQ